MDPALEAPIDSLPVEALSGPVEFVVDSVPDEVLGPPFEGGLDFIPDEVLGGVVEAVILNFIPVGSSGPVVQTYMAGLPAEAGPSSTRIMSPAAGVEQAGPPVTKRLGSTQPGAGPVVSGPLGGVIAAPVIDSASAAQRDTSTTWLVDISLRAHDETGGDLDLTVEYSTTGASGPWSTATPQPHDRKHTVGSPAVLDDVDTAAPGKAYGFTWWAFFDLGEDVVEQVHFRLTATDPTTLQDQAIIGPYTVSTVVVPPDDHYSNLLARRARIAQANRDFLGAGPIIPVEREARDFASATGAELVASCVRVIFMTRAAWGQFAGDLPHRPDFGHKLWTLRHRRLDQTLRGQALAFAKEAIAWEPRAQVKEVVVEDEDPTSPGEMRIRIRYVVIGSNISGNRVILPEFEEIVSVS